MSGVPIKKVNWLLVKSYIGPFIGTFVVSIFLMLMEFLWRYIGDLIGKGLEWYVIFEFIFYSIPYLIPNALPLAVLLSTIMTFGNLGERFELAALKSSGASLLRIMRPLLVVMLLISGMAFYAANILIPRANLSWGALFYDVTHKKPAMNIQDGIFYNELEGISIRVGKKHDDNKSIEDVLIYVKNGSRDGVDVLIAERGKMEFSEDRRFLTMTLEKGKRYQEMTENPEYNKTFPHNQMAFDTYNLTLDLGELELKRSNPELFKDNYKMLNQAELNERMDSMQRLIDRKGVFLLNYLEAYYHLPENSKRDTFRYSPDQLNTPYVDQIGEFIHLDDTTNWKDSAVTVYPEKQSRLERILRRPGLHPGEEQATFVPSAVTKIEKKELIDESKQSMRNLDRIVKSTQEDMRKLKQRQVRYNVQWHKKISLALSCLLLFFVGAPLGAIIKKGGFGTPMIAAILLFILYFILQTVGEKLAREMVIEAWQGVWLSSLVFLPLAIFLTTKANSDSKLFDADFYNRILRNIGQLFSKQAKS